ncbi:MAG: hypothetical protein IKR04_01160 [Clostridia bacterium]|nr:hypothetical protein [Clostridia bacterium]
MEDFLRLLSTLGLTIIIEYPVVQLLWLAIKEKEKSKLAFYKNKIIIIPAIIVNVLTNPALNVFARFLFRDTDMPEDTIWLIITIIEFVIWALEAVMYKYMLNTKWTKAFAMAISANFVSYMSSFII